MTYETIDEIIADIGKPNLTPKHLIQAAYDLGAGVQVAAYDHLEAGIEEAVTSKPLTVEEVEEVEEAEDDQRNDGAFEEELDTPTPN